MSIKRAPDLETPAKSKNMSITKSCFATCFSPKFQEIGAVVSRRQPQLSSTLARLWRPGLGGAKTVGSARREAHAAGLRFGGNQGE